MIVPDDVRAIASFRRGETSRPVTFLAVDTPCPGLICTPMKSLAVPVLVMLFSLIVLPALSVDVGDVLIVTLAAVRLPPSFLGSMLASGSIFLFLIIFIGIRLFS